MGVTAFTTRTLHGVAWIRERRRDENEGAFLRAGDWQDPGVEESARPFLCECPDAGCEEVIWLTADEYASVRGEPDRFVLHPGHERDDADVVVGRTERTVVVEDPPSELFLG